MYKKYWSEDGKKYRLEVKEERVNTRRINGMNFYKTVYKLRIFEKQKWFMGWKSIYRNQWDADSEMDIESKIHKCVGDCFLGNRSSKV
ncbi:hypothetical protein ACFVQB_14425 [Paenibacillus sp. NPDC057886]|uniref:hypothetical protein n=1 Tax=Paenibacillus sp. NPDC057886 TaxID=3346270 RepID=UPI0036BEB54E